MKIVIVGLSITSSWGNGHATTFRALCGELHRRGHRIIFYERNLEWYEHNRDLPQPEFCELRIFDEWQDILSEFRRDLRDADVAMVGSYSPDGIPALDELVEAPTPVKVFYDIDTPVTLAGLRRGDTSYLRRDQIPGLDIYFTFTGGPILHELEIPLGARRVVPLYCSFDPQLYFPRPVNSRFACDLSYMGTYASDRQPKVKELLLDPAMRAPQRRFIVAGPQYPPSIIWPANVEHVKHLVPRFHPEFYSSSRLTLNVTRREMVLSGYAPSVRLFEAAACGAVIVSDNWPGLDAFFIAGREILLAVSTDDVLRFLADYDDAELRRIGGAARDRALAEHTCACRADQFEQQVGQASNAATSAASTRD